jgi:lysozyme family protein
MALFAPAVQNTEMWEGGYSFNPNDAGKETYRGISRANWPTWIGWNLVDSAKQSSHFPSSLDSNLPLQGLVVDFYHTNFWKYDGIADQLSANKLFDLGVNVGIVHAVRIFQRAVFTNDDGIYGPNTEKAINATSSGSLLPIVRREAVSYHNEIVTAHPEDAEFLAGWIRRDNS